VRTFKRDYVYVNQLHDAASVMLQLAAWFEDYNEAHPHKGLADAVTESCKALFDAELRDSVLRIVSTTAPPRV
jgi:hypothetical protein